MAKLFVIPPANARFEYTIRATIPTTKAFRERAFVRDLENRICTALVPFITLNSSKKERAAKWSLARPGLFSFYFSPAWSGCFSTSLVPLRLNEIAPPGQVLTFARLAASWFG